MKKKIIWIAIIAIILGGGALYAYAEYNRKVKDLSGVRAHVKLNAAALITAFETNEADANTRYLDKVIAVNGKVKTIEKDEKGFYSVVLGDTGSMSSVRCSMDSLHQQAAANLTAGVFVTVKGSCTGFNADDLLGSDVILNRCVVEE